MPCRADRNSRAVDEVWNGVPTKHCQLGWGRSGAKPKPSDRDIPAWSLARPWAVNPWFARVGGQASHLCSISQLNDDDKTVRCGSLRRLSGGQYQPPAHRLGSC